LVIKAIREKEENLAFEEDLVYQVYMELKDYRVGMVKRDLEEIQVLAFFLEKWASQDSQGRKVSQETKALKD